MVAVFLLAHALGAAEVVGERHELRAIAEVAVAAAIAVGRGDRRGAERAAVIAALEGEHQALAVRGVAHELQAVLDRLAAADVEMHAALRAELLLGVLGDACAASSIFSRCRYWLATCGSRSSWRRTRVVQARVAVAEIDGRVPHLQVEVRRALRVVEERALAALEDLRRIRCSARCRRASSI